MKRLLFVGALMTAFAAPVIAQTAPTVPARIAWAKGP